MFFFFHIEEKIKYGIVFVLYELSELKSWNSFKIGTYSEQTIKKFKDD